MILCKTSSSLKMGIPNAPPVICRISNGHISATGDPIHFIFGYMVEFQGRRIELRYFCFDQIQLAAGQGLLRRGDGGKLPPL